MSRLGRPAAASWATRRSLGVSESSPLRTGRRGRPPAAMSSVRARSVSASAPQRWARSSAGRRISRLSVRCPSAAEGGAEVGHGAGVLQSRGGAFEHAYRLAQQFDAALSALCQAGGAQGYPERAWGVVGLGERDLLGRERSRFGWRVERELRERGVGAPRCGRWGGDVEASEQAAGGEEVLERRGRAKLGQAKPAPGGEQPSCLHRRRELLGEPVAVICRLGRV